MSSWKIWYQKHPRLFWALFTTVGLLFLTLQTYFAEPRHFSVLLNDLRLPILVVLSGFLLLIFPQETSLLSVGIFYLLLTLFIYFFDIIDKPYGTFSFLFGSWLIIDWVNYKRLRTSLFHEMVRGNYFLAAGVFLSTFLFGLLTEVVNLQFGIWSYHIPIPSLKSFGIPALIAAFGWVPWTLAILAIFYPFTLAKWRPSKLN